MYKNRPKSLTSKGLIDEVNVLSQKIIDMPESSQVFYYLPYTTINDKATFYIPTSKDKDQHSRVKTMNLLYKNSQTTKPHNRPVSAYQRYSSTKTFQCNNGIDTFVPRSTNHRKLQQKHNQRQLDQQQGKKKMSAFERGLNKFYEYRIKELELEIDDPVQSHQTSFSDFYHKQAPKVRKDSSSNSDENAPKQLNVDSRTPSPSSNGLSDIGDPKFKQENGTYLLKGIKKKEPRKKEYSICFPRPKTQEDVQLEAAHKASLMFRLDSIHQSKVQRDCTTYRYLDDTQRFRNANYSPYRSSFMQSQLNQSKKKISPDKIKQLAETTNIATGGVVSPPCDTGGIGNERQTSKLGKFESQQKERSTSGKKQVHKPKTEPVKGLIAFSEPPSNFQKTHTKTKVVEEGLNCADRYAKMQQLEKIGQPIPAYMMYPQHRQIQQSSEPDNSSILTDAELLKRPIALEQSRPSSALNATRLSFTQQRPKSSLIRGHHSAKNKQISSSGHFIRPGSHVKQQDSKAIQHQIIESKQEMVDDYFNSTIPESINIRINTQDNSSNQRKTLGSGNNITNIKSLQATSGAADEDTFVDTSYKQVLVKKRLQSAQPMGKGQQHHQKKQIRLAASHLKINQSSSKDNRVMSAQNQGNSLRTTSRGAERIKSGITHHTSGKGGLSRPGSNNLMFKKQHNSIFVPDGTLTVNSMRTVTDKKSSRRQSNNRSASSSYNNTATASPRILNYTTLGQARTSILTQIQLQSGTCLNTKI